MATVHLVCGPPGAGKSTLARRVATDESAVRLCADDWMITAGIRLDDSLSRALIERSQWDIAEQVLTDGRDVVIEWGLWGRDERERILNRSGELGVGVRAYFLIPPVEVLLARVAARNLALEPAARVSAEVVVDGAARFQGPLADELARYADVIIYRG
jgi:predicted kinase